MTRPAYLTAFGSFLPGEPVENDQIEDVLGRIDGKPSRHRARVLERNGIRRRHYALDRAGGRLHANYEMAARAVRQAIERAGLDDRAVGYLAAATTLSDVLVPGFASLVQGEAKLPPCDIASFHGVCASSVAALKSAFAQVRAGLVDTAVVCGSEFASRHLRASVLERAGLRDRHGNLPFDAEFLRWMLSDGAGAGVVRERPAASGLSLRIEWIDLRSHADTRETCMYAGAAKRDGGGLDRLWSDHASYDDPSVAGMLVLRQDMTLLPAIVPLGLAHYLRLVEDGRVAGAPDWFVCHYSSTHFRTEALARLAEVGLEIPEERWFSNLSERGNTGSASLFLLLGDLLASGRLRRGQRVVAMVPESGRFITCFLAFTVVGPDDVGAPEAAAPTAPAAVGAREAPAGTGSIDELKRRLAVAWIDFAESLRRVPLIARLTSGRATLADYHVLLLNLRQQVVDGSRWISRAASNLTAEHIELRSLFTRHAADEHRDFQMLERDYVATGGDLATIRSGRKNLGSEAFSAFMFQAASRENPFHLAGAMVIIEGLGKGLANEWGTAFCRQLGLSREQCTFMLHHGANDHHHLESLDRALALMPLSPELVDEIVRTARIVARLYRLQLEELGNH